jgi:hypothetical protein
MLAQSLKGAALCDGLSHVDLSLAFLYSDDQEANDQHSELMQKDVANNVLPNLTIWFRDAA